MNRFNLTFSGEILAGHDPAQVRLRFARMFAIDDPVRLERFFSGETVILRRNLERKAAAQCYHELHLLGALAALVKVTASEPAAAANAPSPPKSPANATVAAARPAAANNTTPQSRAGASDQTWAVSSAVSKRTAKSKKRRPAPPAAAPNGADSWQRNTVDIAAGIKARKLEAQRQAADKAARDNAALAEQQRRTAEEAARTQALAQERQRLADEETAQQEAQKKRLAEEEAAKREAIAAAAARKAAEEAAHRAEEQARIRQRDAEEAARKLAIKEEARRKAAEEASRRKAQRKQQKAERALRKAEEVTRRKAEAEEKKRRDAEEEARRKAALEEKKRLEAEEAARRKAMLVEKRRLEAEQAARHRAELEEKARLDAEEAARQKAELEELERREAEEDARLQAELAAIKRREAEEAARLQAELEEKARQAAAQAARIKQEAQRQQLEAQRKSAERRRMAAEALATSTTRTAAAAIKVQRAAAPQVSVPTALKPAKPRIRTALEVPPRKPNQATQSYTPEPRKRQPGEPNLYKLRPFRNTEEVRSRAAQARARMRHSYTLGTIALAALLLVAGSFLQRAITPVTVGARAVVVAPQSGPLLLAGDSLLFHDRAGIGTTAQPLSALGLDALEPPLAFDSNDALYALGRLTVDQQTAAGNALQLLRCDAPLSQCRPFSPELFDSSIDAFVINPLDGSLLLADRSTGLLLKANREGAIVARAAVGFPEQPVLRLHSGLLLMNSSTGPAISVLRYEDNAFGKQLDEILLLPPQAQQAEQLRVGDFLWSGDTWWASLHNPESGATRLYRFDEEWNYVDQVDLPAPVGPLQLASWGQKTLVNDPQHLAIQRFNAQGAVEAPFVSARLEELSAGQQRRDWLVNIAWRSALLLCTLGAILGLGLGYLQGRRSLVYHPRREQGAEPVDDHVDALHWIDPVTNRQALLQRRNISYGLLVLGLVLLAVAQSVSVWQLAALLLALAGPAIALVILSRQAVGHIGILGDRLLLVDHSGMYHLAGGSRVQYRGPFLSIDDVVVYCGDRLFPAFSSAQVQKKVRPLALSGIRVDRDTMMVKLLQCRHPLAQGVLAIVAAVAAAAIVLCLQEIL